MKRRNKTRRRTRQQIDALLGRFHESGMTVKTFAQAEGVNDTSLYKWLRRERAEKAKPVIMEVTPPPGSGARYCIDTPSGYRIEVPSSFSSDALKRLLGVLAP